MTAAGAAHEVRFEQVHRAMALFAHGLGGAARAVQLQGDGRGEGDADATAIRLPAVTDAFATRRENHGAFRLAVLRQLDDVHPVPRFDRWPRPRLARRVYTLLERMRIDCAIERRYPGAHEDLHRARTRALALRGKVPERTRPMRALVDGLVRFSLGADRATLPGDLLLARLLDIAATVRDEAADARDSLRATSGICALLDPAGRRRDLVPLVPAPNGSAFDGPAAGRADTNADPQQTDSAEGDASGGDWSAALAFSLDTADAGTREARHVAPAAPLSAAAPNAHSYFYDEWDSLGRRYLPDWCQVREQRLRGDKLHFLRELRERHAALRGEVRRQFAAIRPAFRQRVHRMLDGDEVDVDGAIAEFVERRAGHLGEGRVFTAVQQPRRDVCAAFLVDMSGSTGFLVPDPQSAQQAAADDDEDDDYYLYQGRAATPAAQRPVRRRVIDIAADALGLMCDALHTLGDRHAVYGFSGEGRHNVAFHVAKAFGDPWSARTAAALAAMQPLGATRTGAAIRHAVARLAREPAATRVLIVVSDGYPQDADYGPVQGDASYGIQDTARALREAAQAGIDTFCIAIDPAGHDYLRTMCAPDRYLVIDDVTALPAQLGKVYRALTVR